MKQFIFISTMLVAMVLFGCKENPYMPSPGDENSQISDTLPILKADTNGIVVSVDSAYAIGASQLQNDVPTAEMYKITATVSSVETNPDDIPHKYTNVNFYINDGGNQSLKCQYTNYLNNYPFRNKTQVPTVGMKVTVVGPLSKYNGNPQMKNGYIMRIEAEPDK